MPCIIFSFAQRDKYQRNFLKLQLAERQLGEFFSEFVRIACVSPSCKQRRKAPRTPLQGGEAPLASPILFPYNPENSISLPPGILTRPIFRGGGVPKGRRVTNDGVRAGVCTRIRD